LAIKVPDTHRELVEKCMQGNRQAFHELYRLYSQGMFNVCLRMMNDRQTAEDILQIAFTEAFMTIKEFRFESTFGAWLKKIIINKCISALRKRKLELEFLDNIENMDLPDEGNDDSAEYENALIVGNIKKAMNQLPDGSRTIFSLYLFEGYDHTEIAEIMGITESTSKSQFMRARLKTKEILSQYSYETR
jgi:RNA polymerase sigma factor (sigma-70 family)